MPSVSIPPQIAQPAAGARKTDTAKRRFHSVVTRYIADSFAGQAKLLARMLRANVRTCQDYIQGRRRISADHLARLLTFERFRDQFLRLLDRECAQ